MMGDSGLLPAPGMLKSRKRRFAARLANGSSKKLLQLHQNPCSQTPVCRAVKKIHKHGWMTSHKSWAAPDGESVVRTVKLEDTTAAKGAVQCWATEEAAKVGVGDWMWWTDRLRLDAAGEEVAAVCNYRTELMSRRTLLHTGRMKIFDAELLAIRLSRELMIKKRETFQRHRVNIVAVVCDSQAAIWWTAYLEPGPGQQLVRRIN
jgi:hypothetical protein